MKLKEGAGNELSEYTEFHHQGYGRKMGVNREKGRRILFVWQARRREGERRKEKGEKEIYKE